MKTSDQLKTFKKSEINTLIKELKTEYDNLSHLHAAVKLRKEKNIKKIAACRQRIARILTVINEKMSEEISKEEK